MTRFQFRRYDLSESRACGDALVTPLLEHRELGEERISSRHWTDTLLDWFWAARGEGVVVDARAAPRPPDLTPGWRGQLARRCANFASPKGGRKTHGEFLFDLAHSTYPKQDTDYWTPKYWDRAFRKPPELSLALESEWGKLSAGVSNAGLVLHDAIKLLHASARAKVVIFASTNEKSRATTVKLAQKLVESDQSRLGTTRPAWLWVDIPWSIWSHEHAPKWWAGPAGGPLSSAAYSAAPAPPCHARKTPTGGMNVGHTRVSQNVAGRSAD